MGECSKIALYGSDRNCFMLDLMTPQLHTKMDRLPVHVNCESNGVQKVSSFPAHNLFIIATRNSLFCDLLQ